VQVPQLSNSLEVTVTKAGWAVHTGPHKATTRNRESRHKGKILVNTNAICDHCHVTFTRTQSDRQSLPYVSPCSCCFSQACFFLGLLFDPEDGDSETSVKTIVVLYSVISQKVVFIILTAVITSNPTLNIFIGNDSERGWYKTAVAN
jgi:hypothetical protein